MQSLPYELLQQISSCLLPRSQCRLAMVSHHCYRHLYTPLLRWHARKNSITLPKHDIMGKRNNETLLFTGKNVVLYNNTESKDKRIYNCFNVVNLSTCEATSLVCKPNKTVRIDYKIIILMLCHIIDRLYLPNAYRKYLYMQGSFLKSGK